MISALQSSILNGRYVSIEFRLSLDYVSTLVQGIPITEFLFLHSKILNDRYVSIELRYYFPAVLTI